MQTLLLFNDDDDDHGGTLITMFQKQNPTRAAKLWHLWVIVQLQLWSWSTNNYEAATSLS